MSNCHCSECQARNEASLAPESRLARYISRLIVHLDALQLDPHLHEQTKRKLSAMVDEGEKLLWEYGV